MNSIKLSLNEEFVIESFFIIVLTITTFMILNVLYKIIKDAIGLRNTTQNNTLKRHEYDKEDKEFQSEEELVNTILQDKFLCGDIEISLDTCNINETIIKYECHNEYWEYIDFKEKESIHSLLENISEFFLDYICYSENFFSDIYRFKIQILECEDLYCNSCCNVEIDLTIEKTELDKIDWENCDTYKLTRLFSKICYEQILKFEDFNYD